MKINICEISAYMHITGKISEENLSFTTMEKSNALIGVHKSTCITTEMVAKMNIDAQAAMGGRSSNITLKTIN